MQQSLKNTNNAKNQTNKTQEIAFADQQLTQKAMGPPCRPPLRQAKETVDKGKKTRKKKEEVFFFSSVVQLPCVPSVTETARPSSAVELAEGEMTARETRR